MKNEIVGIILIGTLVGLEPLKSGEINGNKYSGGLKMSLKIVVTSSKVIDGRTYINENERLLNYKLNLPDSEIPKMYDAYSTQMGKNIKINVDTVDKMNIKGVIQEESIK